MKQKPTEEEIDEALNKASESEEGGESRWPGMTYEQGVHAAIMWMLGHRKDNPMDD
jgi:hypothetical protein